MAGEYRAMLKGTKYEDIRLALTDRPMIGVTHRRDLVPELIEFFTKDGSAIALGYAQKLTAGSVVPITEDYPHDSDGGTGRFAHRPERVWGPGELFFRS